MTVKEAVVTTSLRLPETLHAGLVAQARREGRSLNAQIVYLLQKAYRVREQGWTE